MKPFYLKGRWATSSEHHAVSNPWDGKKIADICLGDAGQVEEAVASAHEAFQKARKEPAWQRAKTLNRVADLIASRRAEFVETIVAEAGKPVIPAEAEVDRATMTFRFAAQLAMADEGQGIRMDASPPGEGHFGIVRRFPMGVILGITPFNFPLNLVAHKVAPCLATGNAMVLKPALKTPLSSLLLAEVLHEAGVTPGQINVVPFGHEHIPPLLHDERIKMVSFTGSAAVGWKLKSDAVKMKVTLELGGNAAAVVEPDADWKAAIPMIGAGAYGYAGQSCISVQRIFVQREIYEDFRQGLVAFIKDKIKAGDPRDRAVVVGPMISQDACAKVRKWVDEAVAGGAKALTEIKVEQGNLLHPVLLENVPMDCSISCEEAFAPVAVLQPYDSYEEALDLVNASVYGLQAGVFTPDLKKAMKAFETIEAGGVLVNQVPTFRVENMPYGGIKDSGFGREGVRYAMEEMTEPRSLIINFR